MPFLVKKVRVVTHDGKFHADDVFSVAVLDILYRGQIKVIRTRAEKYFTKGDIVLDVSMKSDGDKYFDHHQQGGAGERPNGIPYASFGLIWKKFGKALVSSDEVFKRFDRKMVQVIDADDNGKKIFTSTDPVTIRLYGIPEIIDAYNPLAAGEPSPSDYDQNFAVAVEFAKVCIKNELRKIEDTVKGETQAIQDWQRSDDQRYVVLTSMRSFGEAFINKPQVLYAISEREKGKWAVSALRLGPGDYTPRKPLPEAWAGKRDKELEQVTGVKGAVFCHRGRFMAATDSKDAALALVKLALQ